MNILKTKLTKNLYFIILTISIVQCKKPDYSTIEINPNEVSLGDIKVNQNKSITVKINNPSTKELIVYGVQPSCGCTIINKDEFVIPSGSFYDLAIDYEAKELGNFTETVVIKANTDPPFHNIPIKGRVIN